MYEVLKVKAGNSITYMIVNTEQIDSVISHLEAMSRLPEYRYDIEAILESAAAEYDCAVVETHFVDLELW